MIPFIKKYPLPIFALFGLILGLVFYFLLDQRDVSQWIWLITLVIGGIPVVIQTGKGMIKGEFASDIVAMLAIITAVIMQEWFRALLLF